MRISFGNEHKHSDHLSSTLLPAQVYSSAQGFASPPQIENYSRKAITDVLGDWWERQQSEP